MAQNMFKSIYAQTLQAGANTVMATRNFNSNGDLKQLEADIGMQLNDQTKKNIAAIVEPVRAIVEGNGIGQTGAPSDIEALSVMFNKPYLSQLVDISTNQRVNIINQLGILFKRATAANDLIIKLNNAGALQNLVSQGVITADSIPTMDNIQRDVFDLINMYAEYMTVEGIESRELLNAAGLATLTHGKISTLTDPTPELAMLYGVQRSTGAMNLGVVNTQQGFGNPNAGNMNVQPQVPAGSYIDMMQAWSGGRTPQGTMPQPQLYTGVINQPQQQQVWAPPLSQPVNYAPQMNMQPQYQQPVQQYGQMPLTVMGTGVGYGNQPMQQGQKLMPSITANPAAYGFTVPNIGQPPVQQYQTQYQPPQMNMQPQPQVQYANLMQNPYAQQPIVQRPLFSGFLQNTQQYQPQYQMPQMNYGAPQYNQGPTIVGYDNYGRPIYGAAQQQPVATGGYEVVRLPGI